MAACDVSPPAADRDPGATDTASRGGHVTFGVLGEPPTLDPYSPEASDLTYFLARPVYRSLFRIDPDGVVRPDLVSLGEAGSLEPVRDGVIATIVRARWSDGEPVTAADVVRSATRATYPSGFAGLHARAVGRRRVRFTGDVFGDWARRLAVGTYVMPPGRSLRVAGGPFVVDRFVPGLEISYVRNPRWDGKAASLSRITVRFVASVEIMLQLLQDGRLDAAAVPSAVNLDDRLDTLKLEHAAVPGWEHIVLDFEQLSEPELRSTIAGSIDRAHIARGLIRDEGKVARAPSPQPRGGVDRELVLGTAAGDELLTLMQRVLQRSFKAKGIDVDLATIDPATFYGAWESESPLDVALRREIVPRFYDRRVPGDLSWFPLFVVDTFAVWTDAVAGVTPNGTLEGPLWNAEEWTRH